MIAFALWVIIILTADAYAGIKQIKNVWTQQNVSSSVGEVLAIIGLNWVSPSNPSVPYWLWYSRSFKEALNEAPMMLRGASLSEGFKTGRYTNFCTILYNLRGCTGKRILLSSSNCCFFISKNYCFFQLYWNDNL